VPLGKVLKPVLNTSKGASMKKTLIRFILIASALLAMSATTAMADGGGLPPLCYPGKPCPFPPINR